MPFEADGSHERDHTARDLWDELMDAIGRRRETAVAFTRARNAPSV